MSSSSRRRRRLRTASGPTPGPPRVAKNRIVPPPYRRGQRARAVRAHGSVASRRRLRARVEHRSTSDPGAARSHSHCSASRIARTVHSGRGEGRGEESLVAQGRAQGRLEGDAPHSTLRGEGRGALPGRRAAGIPHVAIGQEACAVGVCRALEDGDVIALDAPRARPHARQGHSSERADGRALREDRRLLARLRRLDASLRHRARNMGANAVIGGGLPHITGAALAFQLRGEPRVALAFFGDGATNIGTFHEALNPRSSGWCRPSSCSRTMAGRNRRRRASIRRSAISPSAQKAFG